ncbi:hypothetical protein [Thiofilum flexile]|uniref:hypothetical protein n=1 Tax=Thiofilum flexile TaxID=125627 RepID=UPI0003820A28|nr:hypothetical protein [Thiofilum flexile]
MKKYFFPLLMGVLILFGVVLTATPWVADYLIPAKTTGYRRAPAPEAQEALANWFNVHPNEVKYPEAIQYITPEQKTAWFKFDIERKPVEQFIRAMGLKQMDLTAEVMQQRFLAHKPPVDWWRPTELTRQTYFTGLSGGQTLSLVYNAELQRGYLLVNTPIDPKSP